MSIPSKLAFRMIDQTYLRVLDPAEDLLLCLWCADHADRTLFLANYGEWFWVVLFFDNWDPPNSKSTNRAVQKIIEERKDRRDEAECSFDVMANFKKVMERMKKDPL